MEYRSLEECRGSCRKKRPVDETNCIGYNPEHPDCRYSTYQSFKGGFCPYYIPAPEEKNYRGELEDIPGVHYLRQPFWVLCLPVPLFFLLAVVLAVINGDFFSISFFLAGLIPNSVVLLLVGVIGGGLYAKFAENRLLAVINEDGVYTPRFLLEWENIIKVKTHVTSKRSPSLTELELVMKVDEYFYDHESVYLYFSTLRLRRDIKKKLAKRKREAQSAGA